MVGADGVARVLDFGGRESFHAKSDHESRRGQGQSRLHGTGTAAREDIDQRADIFSAGVVLWEALGMHRLFRTTTSGPWSATC